MRRAAMLALVAPLVLAGSVAAQEPSRAREPVTTESPRPTPSPESGLSLGPFGRPGAESPDAILRDLPRFAEMVDVHGQAPLEPNQAMAVWWRHYDFETSVYGRGYNIQQPVHPGSVNLIPLFEWLAKKAQPKK